MHSQQTKADGDGRLGTALGWFSIGLGLAELASPGGVARLAGIEDDDRNRNILRAFGARELAAGVGILARERPTGWMWGRVAGDAVDLAFLGTSLGTGDASRGRIAAASAAVAGVTALDVICGRRLLNTKGAPGVRPGAARVATSVTINRPVADVYAFWREFENLPRFMHHLESVDVVSSRRSHWKASAPAGMSVEWDAEIVDERPNELIAWRSLRNAMVSHEGRVRFRPAPGHRGTEVHVELRYNPPAGSAGRALAWLFGEEPGQQIRDDLRRFKQLMETGEVPISEGSLSLRQPARPLSGQPTAR